MDKAQYSFENVCIEDTSLKLGDATKKLFFNAKAYEKADDPEVKAFQKYVSGQSSDSDFVKVLEEKIKTVKKKREWKVNT